MISFPHFGLCLEFRNRSLDGSLLHTKKNYDEEGSLRETYRNVEIDTTRSEGSNAMFDIKKKACTHDKISQKNKSSSGTHEKKAKKMEGKRNAHNFSLVKRKIPIFYFSAQPDG